MQIAMDKIHPAKYPIREMMDEEKLNALIESIQEAGQKVAVKVRPIGSNGDYELIWGHRRWEALKRLDAHEIEANVEECDDTEALRQAIVENFVRDDGTDIEKGKALKRLYEQEKAIDERTSYAKIGALVGMAEDSVGTLIRLVNDSLVSYINHREDGDLYNLAGLAHKADATRPLKDDEIRLRVLEQPHNAIHIRTIVNALKPLDKADRLAVLDKAQEERLKPIEIEKVAAAVQEAGERSSPVVRFAALNTPGNAPNYSKQVQDRIHTIEQQDFEQERKQEKKSKEVQDYDKLVKDGIKHLRQLSSWVEDVGYEAINQDKFSPEAARFFVGRFDALVKEYQQRFRVQLIALSKEKHRE